jgi:pimeloyl-ACP methyl ester carboxylesterase
VGMLVAAWLAAAPVSLADDPDPSGYCAGDGGAAGAATAAEHTVVLGDPKLPTGVTQFRVTVGGVSTRVIQAGPADASSAVVFVHGNPGSARDFDDLVAQAGRFTRTVAFDIPGWGKSDKLAHTELQTTDGAAAYVQGVLDQLGIKRVVLAAHDFGGIWGLQWASQHPDALIGVVLIDTGVLKDYTPHALAIVWSIPGVGEAQVASTTRQTFHQAVNYMQTRPLPDAFIDRMYDDYDRPERCALLRYYRSMRDATFANSNAVADKQAAALKKRRRPALVIWGQNDPYIPAEQAYKQRDVFPGARVEVFPDTGHWSFVEEPARTRRLAVSFLRPSLAASALRTRAGARRVRVRVSVSGMLPAFSVFARSGGARSAAVKLAPGAKRTLTIRLARRLRPGVRRIAVHALGLPTRHLRVRVGQAARPSAHAGAPQLAG